MARFYRYETTEIQLNFTPTGVLNDYRHIVVSIAQDGMVQVNKQDTDLSIDTQTNKIVVPLSQEETGKFAGGETTPRQAKIQVNIYYENGQRDVSTIGYIDVYENLFKKVIDNE